MHTARCPAGLPAFGYSMQAAAIASALVEREFAPVYRTEVREWLDRIDSMEGASDHTEEGQRFAEFITNLVRVGAGLPETEGLEATG